jgi:hypothetical protein
VSDLSTQELAELFLAHLYELAEAAPHPNFLFSANDFAPLFGINDTGELQKALQYLGDRGLVILAGLDPLGGVSAGITIEGSVFVEEGGETGIIERYHKDRGAFITTSPEVPSMASFFPADSIDTSPGTEKQGAFYAGRAINAILADIEEILDRDADVSTETKRDVLSDLATLKIQMERNVKNKAVIGAMLESLAEVPSIAPLVTALNCIVMAYFR